VSAFRNQAEFKKPNTSTQELDPFPQKQNTPGKTVKYWIGCFIQGGGTLMHPGLTSAFETYLGNWYHAVAATHIFSSL
jgi:hypothetical protein